MATKFMLVLLCGIFKLSTIFSLEHCGDDVEVAEVKDIEALPDFDSATEVKVTTTSDQDLFADIRLDEAVVPYNTEVAGPFHATKTKRGNSYTFKVVSSQPMNTSTIRFGFGAIHPCNTAVIWLDLLLLKHMLDQAISFPTVSVMPKSGYKVDKNDLFSIEFEVAIVDDNRLSLDDYQRGENAVLIQLAQEWIGGRLRVMRQPRKRQIPRPKKIEFRNSNRTNGDFLFLRSEVKAQLGDRIPFDGIVLQFWRQFQVSGTSLKIYIFITTALQFSNTGPIPIGVDALFRTTSNLVEIDFKELGGPDLITVGLNYNTSKTRRGLSCSAVGIEDAPKVAAAKLKDPNDTYISLVDELFPNAVFGARGFAEFRVDIDLGEEAFYICSASNGNIVTSLFVKVISLIPITLKINEENESPLYQSSCKVYGYPRPQVRLFLVPSNSIKWGEVPEGWYDYKLFPVEFKGYEILEDTHGLRRTERINDGGIKASIFFDWIAVKQLYGNAIQGPFIFTCVAWNQYQGDIEKRYLSTVGSRLSRQLLGTTKISLQGLAA